MGLQGWGGQPILFLKLKALGTASERGNVFVTPNCAHLKGDPIMSYADCTTTKEKFRVNALPLWGNSLLTETGAAGLFPVTDKRSFVVGGHGLKAQTTVKAFYRLGKTGHLKKQLQG